MKRFGIVFTLVLTLLCSIYAFAENITQGTGALSAVTTGDDNSAIGSYSLRSLTTGHGNTGLGAYAGRSALTVNGGVYLGYGAGISNTSAHKLYINTMFYPAYGIFGDFSTGYFGVNNTAPGVALDVTGAITASGAYIGTTGAFSGAVTATSVATPTTGGVFSIPDSLNVTGVFTVPTIKTAVSGGVLSLSDSVDVTGVLTVSTIKTATSGTQLSLADSVDISGALNVSGSLLHQAKVISTTGDYTLTAAMSGSVVNNYNSAASDSLFLPACATELLFDFISTDADTMFIQCASGDSIFSGASLKPSFEGHAVNQSFSILGLPTNGGQFNWIVKSSTGTWTGN